MRVSIKKSIIVFVTTVLAVAVSAAPAEARTIWSNGVQVSPWPSNVDADIDGVWSQGNGCGLRGRGGLRAYGDHLYIKDDCADGHSVFAEVKIVGGNTYRCKNSRGRGTIVWCNFDLPETFMVFLVGVSNGNDVLWRDHGNSVHLNKHGDEL